MKKLLKIALFLSFLMTISCSQEQRIHRLERRAEAELSELRSAILSSNTDSIWLITHRIPEVHYFIFRDNQAVYWSNNSLTTPLMTIPQYDEWFEYDFSNAYCCCYWTHVGEYRVAAIIPTAWHITNAREGIEQSFSYQPLLEDMDKTKSYGISPRNQARIFFWLTISFIVILISIVVVSIIRAHGFKNLQMRSKIQFSIISMVLVGHLGVLLVSVVFFRKHYQSRQEADLQRQCRFVQSALQNLYFWDYSTDGISQLGLNADLRDLAHAYGTDIHVYDLNGRLLGSSTPQLFQNRLLSVYLAPEVMFSDNNTQTCYSSLGDIRYLSAYTEFVNGSFMQLGYIAIPQFISEVELAREMDSFFAHLFPVYILILLISIGGALFLTRDLAAENARMVDELNRNARQLARLEREGAWRTMARQIAHEINNPLTPMKLTLQQLQRIKGTDKFDAQFDKATATLLSQMDNLSRIATSFSTYTKQPEVSPSEVDIAQKLSAVVTLVTNNPQGTPIRYFGPESGVMVQADKEQISQVFTNILRNAVQAINGAEGGDIMVILKDDIHQPEVEISFSDNGPGIPEDVQPKIFLPNFTTKSTGAGLGLAISKNIVEGSGGRIRFETSKHGTTFYIYLPRV